MLYLWLKNLTINSLKIKIIEKLEIIAIIQVNIEAQQTVFVIENLMCPMKPMYFFIMVQTIIIILL